MTIADIESVPPVYCPWSVGTPGPVRPLLLYLKILYPTPSVSLQRLVVKQSKQYCLTWDLRNYRDLTGILQRTKVTENGELGKERVSFT